MDEKENFKNLSEISDQEIFQIAHKIEQEYKILSNFVIKGNKNWKKYFFISRSQF